MTDIHPVPPHAAAITRTSAQDYARLHAQATTAPDAFWRDQLGRLDWVRRPTIMGNWNWNPVNIRWFEDGILNATATTLDRWADSDPNRRAILWEADDPATPNRTLTYGELRAETCRMANVLRSLGVERGDRVTIYMPMIPEAAVAMLACARLGAVHSVIFGGFSPQSIAGRLADADSRVIITADEGMRGGKPIPLKANIDAACTLDPRVETILVVRHTGAPVPLAEGRDHWWHDLRDAAPDTFAPEPMSAEDPLFILYTSGSTGSPKGVLHTTAGYLMWASLTFERVFDYREGELFWCTADVGWVTGHSYIVYGPLSCGATVLMFEGVPTHPTVSRFWQVIEKHRVNIFYTAPTALRALMRDGDAPVRRHDLSSLRLLGTVGEPINPEAWRWYHQVVGGSRLPIVDTWWQTETGGTMMTPLPGAHAAKPGAASFPFLGVAPALVDTDGKFIEGEPAEGNLVLTASWPGQARTLYGDHERFTQTYFTTYPGLYFTGDGARRDADGYWWITGRVDDVLNVSGHRLGTAEIESALVAHPDIAEAAVVGFPHDVKGQGIYAYATPNAGVEMTSELEAELKALVRREIGAIATPDVVHLAVALPKTRSGKIMRRILRKIAEGDVGNLGDVSTLADPGVVEGLVAKRRTTDKHNADLTPLR